MIESNSSEAAVDRLPTARGFKKAFLIPLACVFSLLTLAGCQTSVKDLHGDPLAGQALNATVAAAFAPDGRLWRIIPTREGVFADSSADNGKTYEKPVRVSSADQKINAWPENPPLIEIAPSGKIYVLYAADERQKATSFFTFSDDNGQTFSKPAKISDHADSALNYMNAMLVDNREKVYLFWHDSRHEQHDNPLGAGVLSLYYAVTGDPLSGQFDNRFVSDAVCSCCRTATAFSPGNKPVLLTRVVFPGGVRDHALIGMDGAGKWLPPRRVTQDGWKIDACPEHGPALAIDRQGRAHLTWFTLGNNRRGIYYAHSDDDGKTVSAPLAIGNNSRLPGHPDVIAVNGRVVLAWQEFDGKRTAIFVEQSADRGGQWSSPREIAGSPGKSGHPKLISNGKRIFLSWSTAEGHQLTEISP